MLSGNLFTKESAEQIEDRPRFPSGEAQSVFCFDMGLALLPRCGDFSFIFLPGLQEWRKWIVFAGIFCYDEEKLC